MIPFLHLWRLTIPTFGLMVAAAMLVSFYVLRTDLARRGIAKKDSGVAEAFVAIPCFAGIIGAKLYHLLQTPRDLIASPRSEIFSQYGFAWFGGLLAGVGAFMWLANRHKIPLLTMLDAGSPAAAVGYGIGRIGCLLSGDGDYGTATSLPWGMSFPNGIVPTSDRVHPTPIYEFLIACFIAVILWKLGSWESVAGGKTATAAGAALGSCASSASGRPGLVFGTYLVLTGIARFLVEFIRINPRSFLGMTNAQVASLLSIAAGIFVFWVAAHRAAVADNRGFKKKSPTLQ